MGKKILANSARKRNRIRPIWYFLLAWSVLFAHGFGQIHATVHPAGGHSHTQLASSSSSFAGTAQQSGGGWLTELVDALCASPLACTSLDHQLGSTSPTSNSLIWAFKLPPASAFSLLPLPVMATIPASLNARGPPALLSKF